MLKFFNTLTRKKEEFRPINDKEVGIYTCGPTVYDFAHIGNLRAYIFADILRRALEYNKYKVKQILNITDVGHLTGDRDMGEDKVETAARQQHKSAWEIASYYTDAFKQDLAKLNIKNPSKFIRATDHIRDMIKLIEVLEKKGFTYQTSDGVYFDTSKIKDYGKLAKLDLEGLKEGARVEKNEEKKNLTDFALWKLSQKSKKREMEWDSPWGVGFPGWHIECSAMSAKYLGQPFDIHTGGIDHIPVHHTNEIAQSEAATGKPLANMWLHSEFVNVDDTRIGKSEGNLITLEKLVKKGYSPITYRYFILQGHYRSKLNFSFTALESAKNSLNNLYATMAQAKSAKIGAADFEKDFFEKINDDLNTPEALAVLWNMVKSDYPPGAKLASLFEMDKVLGLDLKASWEEFKKPLPKEVEKLKTERDVAREKKDWNKADSLREQIDKKGYQVNDTEQGSIIGIKK